MDIFIDKPSSRRRVVVSKLNIGQRWLQLAIPLGVFLVALLPRILDLNAFITADEDDQIMFSTLFLKSALKGDWAGALVLGYPGVPTLILGAVGVGLRYLFHYAGWLPLSWATADLFTTLDQVTTQFGIFAYPLDFLRWVRVPMAVAASLSIVGIYLLVRRLLDERLALLGTLIIAFDPFILAHSRIIHVDAPLSYFMFLSFLTFLLYIDQGRLKWLILSGLFGGLAALSKTPAGLLGPILVVSGLFYALFPPPEVPRSVRWKRLMIALVGWGIIALGAFFALWPAMWTRPAYALEWIIGNIRSVNRTAHPTTGIFWGEQPSDQNPLYYLIVFPYHLTPLTTVGVLGGLGLIGAGFVAYWRNLNRWAARILPLASGLVAYVVIFIAPVSVISRRGDRYILPVFFATGLLSALALWWLALQAKKYLPTILDRFGLTPLRLVLAAILVQTFFVFLYHPYYLAYYNPMIGGGQTAPYRINVGWGEGLDVAARYLNGLNDQKPSQAASWYSGQFAPFYHGQTLDLSDQISALTTDYTVFYINQVQRGFPSHEILMYFQQREPLHVVELGGIEYAWIYEGPVVGQRPPENYTFPVEIILGGGARLIGLDVSQLTFPADAFAVSDQELEADVRHESAIAVYKKNQLGLPVTLYWETVARISGEHNIYIRLADDQGHTWGQVDRLILAGLQRPDRWHPGYFLRDEYRLPIDPATPPGTYHFEVGMYDFVTGQSYGVARNIGEITLTPPNRLPQIEALSLEAHSATSMNETLTLAGHDYVDQVLPPGGEVAGKIFWQTVKTTEKDYAVEFSLLAPDRQRYVIAEAPLSASYPTSRWRRSEVMGAAYRFHLPPFAPAGQYPLSVTVIDPDTGQSVGPAVTLANITVQAPERNFELPGNVVPMSVVVGDEMELVGYRLIDQTVAPRDAFGLTLYWRSLRPAESNYTVFVHAVGPDQIMRGQWDSIPARGLAPTSGWLPGEIIEDHYKVPMAKDAPSWKYDIFVGMYDPLTGERLPLAGQHSPISDNRAWLTRVQVVEK